MELRGVQVEKALRGESNGSFLDEHKEESELLKEWFDLMRDRTELRRYEKELMVRAQELELEDRHARLQHELRDRLENSKYTMYKKLQTKNFLRLLQIEKLRILRCLIYLFDFQTNRKRKKKWKWKAISSKK